MFGLKSKRAEALGLQAMAPTSSGVTVMERTPELIRPSRPEPLPMPAKTYDHQMFDYMQLAERVGTADVGLVLKRAVADFLWENDIGIYDYDECVAYLKPFANAKKKLICWRPLRDRDHIKGWQWGDDGKHDFYRNEAWACRSYELPVPFDVLKNVELIEKKFGERVKFFVSDYGVYDPDPFIIVRNRGFGEGLVFGVWDEPTFFGTASS